MIAEETHCKPHPHPQPKYNNKFAHPLWICSGHPGAGIASPLPPFAAPSSLRTALEFGGRERCIMEAKWWETFLHSRTCDRHNEERRRSRRRSSGKRPEKKLKLIRQQQQQQEGGQQKQLNGKWSALDYSIWLWTRLWLNYDHRPPSSSPPSPLLLYTSPLPCLHCLMALWQLSRL